MIITQYIAKVGLNTLPFTEEKLIELCMQEGFLVRSYSVSIKLIKAIGAEESMQAPAFVCDREGIKFIFYDDNLSASDRLFYVTHELCHIVLKHPAKGDPVNDTGNLTQEDEANSSAYELLAPLCVLRDMDVKTIDDIARVTGLSYGQAEIIHSRLLTYKGRNGLVEKAIIHNFRAEMHYKEPDELEPISVDLDKLNKKHYKWYEWAFTGFLFLTFISLLVCFIMLIPNVKKPDKFDVTPEQYEWLHSPLESES